MLLLTSVHLSFLILAVIAQIFNLTSELVIPTGTATNEVNPENKTQLVIVETKTRN